MHILQILCYNIYNRENNYFLNIYDHVYWYIIIIIIMCIGIIGYRFIIYIYNIVSLYIYIILLRMCSRDECIKYTVNTQILYTFR